MFTGGGAAGADAERGGDEGGENHVAALETNAMR